MTTGRIPDNLAIQLAFLYGNDTEMIVNLASIEQQRGEVDCGLFAAAVCLSIAGLSNLFCSRPQ